MKNFLSLAVAGAVGSAITIGSYVALRSDGEAFGPRVVTLERSASPTPAGQVRLASGGRYAAVPFDFTVAADKATPAVVHITTSYKAQGTARRGGASPRGGEQINPFDFFGFGDGQMQPQRPSQASGSGVIISADGYIVTNNHVVADASDITVVLNDKRSVKARLVGTDPSTDLAVVKISEPNLQTLPFANSDDVKPGQWAVAVGNPFNLESTVTAGIISAKGRNLRIVQDSLAIESFIQTDAAVNPGNSGGALVNTDGALIGINTAIASQTGSFAGYAFAVPSNIVTKVVEDLIRHGVVQRGLLGVRIQDVNSKLATEKELEVQDGVYIGEVTKNSAGAAAGLKAGDVILAIDGRPTLSSAALQEQIARRRPGDKVQVLLNRKGKQETVPVTLFNRQGSTAIVKKEVAAEAGPASPTATLGLELKDLDAKQLSRLGVAAGVKVDKISDGIVAEQTDMREGFVITRIDKKAVKSVEQAKKALGSGMKEGVLVEGVYPDEPGTQFYAFGAGG